jgi:hypothetical protein
VGIWDRLETVVKSYLNDDTVFKSRGSRTGTHGDPDLNAAYDELNDFLNKDKAEPASDRGGADGQAPPEALRADFAELGLPFGASAEECKESYKKLLKIHHPDRHANHQGNFTKATEKSARLNAAYDRICQWRAGK